MRQDILDRKEEILQWIADEKPLCFIKDQLGCKYETLRHYLLKLGIVYAGQKAKKGQLKNPNCKKSAIEYSHGTSIHSHILKLKLIEEGIKEARCEICHNSHWNSLPIPLELHHIDGNHTNNAFVNLQILCPNCHAQCENNSGKNIKSYKQKLGDLAQLADASGLDPDDPKGWEFESPSPHQRKKYSAAELAELASEGRIDTSGRITHQMLSKSEWEERKQLILQAEVDLSKFGWKSKVQRITGLTRRQVDDVIDHFYDTFKDIIYIR